MCAIGQERFVTADISGCLREQATFTEQDDTSSGGCAPLVAHVPRTPETAFETSL